MIVIVRLRGKNLSQGELYPKLTIFGAKIFNGGKTTLAKFRFRQILQSQNPRRPARLRTNAFRCDGQYAIF
jgi:hypothetical protein